MLAIGSKTPVSLLQEHFIAKGIVPFYELIRSKVGTHEPEFTMRVKVGSCLWEEGTAKSKQQAKQKAAEKMLIALKIIDNNDSSNDSGLEFTEDDVKENYVGLLKEYCYIHQYPQTRYELEEEAGPPHSKIFKMVCFVSQLRDFGIARTKKVAKQQAAFKMLERLKKLGKNNTEDDSSNIIKKIPEIKLNDDEINTKYASARSMMLFDYDQPAAYYKDHHKAYLDLPNQSSELARLMRTNLYSENDAHEILNKICTELEVKLTRFEIPTKEESVKLSGISMSVIPVINSLGRDDKNAAFNLLESLLLLCQK